MIPELARIAESVNHGDLPESWQIPEPNTFSASKILYDYQTDALKKAAQALYLYYGGELDWDACESAQTNSLRKERFISLYGNTVPSANLRIPKYETIADKNNEKQNQIFRILSDYMDYSNEFISYQHLINRMCFWMATGSGKTLVMVKLIEYLYSLQQHREIPPHNVLILAPSNQLIGQIKKTIDDFNQSGLHINLSPLRENNQAHQARLDHSVTVYYHRSDNISDVQKEALTDYRTYENDGKWYVFLDEAHKGGKEDSKRQAYYAVMAREGFLFNFSATFTDKEDIITTVKKYDLEEFIKNGRGKNIYLNESEFISFKDRKEEISNEERKKIVLKSLITLAYASIRAKELRQSTALENLYHLPLMLTLVNSVNTDIENERNDLWAFFQTLREIATGEIDQLMFKNAQQELIEGWQKTELLFSQTNKWINDADEQAIKKMKITDLREAVFLNRRKGALQFVSSNDNKELAFQMKNADLPFALIKIGDTSKWRNQLLYGYEETTTLQRQSFFNNLDQSSITILMGSRAFFESWDSNRPNVINFINIGGKNANKFVVQSVGRGIRIEPLPNQRQRLDWLLPTMEEMTRQELEHHCNRVQPLETLFLFATNKSAINSVLKGLKLNENSIFEKLEGFEQSPTPKINSKDMPLLVPEYQETKTNKNLDRPPFSMSEKTFSRFKEWIARTSDSIFLTRDRLTVSEIRELRDLAIDQNNNIKFNNQQDYATLTFLQTRLVFYLSQKTKVFDSVRKLNTEKDIVHFREIRALSEHIQELQEKIARVKVGKMTDEDIVASAKKFEKKEITREEFIEQSTGKDEENFKELTIKKIVNHYYLPVIFTDTENINYIKHIIKVPSEVQFLNALGSWVNEKPETLASWDAWMFSKIDETVDNVHIPYYDATQNKYRPFSPDFVFWMCRKNKYRIAFVDPKGETHTSAYHKIDGYKQLFCSNGITRPFKHDNWQVSVELYLYNPNASPLKHYKKFWIDHPQTIFNH